MEIKCKRKMTQDEIIKSHYPFYDPDIAMKDIEINAEAVKQLMDLYLIDQLKGLVENLRFVHSEYILERIKDEIKSLEEGI